MMDSIRIIGEHKHVLYELVSFIRNFPVYKIKGI